MSHHRFFIAIGFRINVLLVGCCLVTGFLTLSGDVNADHHESTQAAKFGRFQTGDTVAYGIVDGGRIVQLSGDPFGEWEKTETSYSLDEVTWLVPTQPGKVLALAGNYRDHLGDHPAPANPEPFFKGPGSLIPHGANIEVPTDNVHYEAELVIVIKKRASDVPVEDALDYVLGVTCGNDVTERDWQKNDAQWWRGKGADTFGPCGPFIATGIDYQNLEMTLLVNGEVRQQSNTKMQIHGIAETVSFISRHVTLEPGDLVFTGTPGKTAALRAGDTVEVVIEGVGTLSNPVVKEPTHVVAMAPAEPADMRSIFNGVDLNGWDGDPRLWSVKDGAIHGETTAEGAANGNTFLIWQGGRTKDFELRLSFRCNATNNSGIQYRSRHIDDDSVPNKWVVRGYQHEIRNEIDLPSVSGFIYDEGGKRGRMCLVGEQATWEADGNKQVTSTLISAEEFQQLFKLDDWNDVIIMADGNHIRHYLNGRLILDFTDADPDSALLDGVLALQLHAGPPMWAEFKNIRFRDLPSD